MLMCLGVVLGFVLFAVAGIAVALILGYLVLSTDPGLQLSKVSLSLFCGAALAGMAAYSLSQDTLRAAIVFYDEIPEFVHVGMPVVAGACSGWLFLRVVALIFPSIRAPRG